MAGESSPFEQLQRHCLSASQGLHCFGQLAVLKMQSCRPALMNSLAIAFASHVVTIGRHYGGPFPLMVAPLVDQFSKLIKVSFQL